jgi:beta-mannosidase
MHYWSVWHEGKPFEAYREVTPRFCSEFGFQSFPSRTDIQAFCPEDQLNITSPVMESHQRNDRGNTIIISTISRYFRFPSSFDHILYLSQVQQAMAINTAVNFWRSRRPVCMGTLYWQLNDTWPGASWSSIAYSGAWKLLHYAARRFYAPQLISLIPTDDHTVEIFGINDTQQQIEGELLITTVSFSGEQTVIHRSIQSIGPACSQMLASIDVLSFDSGRQMLKASLSHLSQTLLLSAPKACYLHTPEITVEETVDGNLVLYSDVPALFVTLEISGWEGRFSDNGFHLLNGESKTVVAEKSKLPPDWRKRLRIINLRETY